MMPAVNTSRHLAGLGLFESGAANPAETSKSKMRDERSIWLTIQISHARRAWVPPLLKYGAMLSGDIMGDLGEIKGVGLWLTGSASSAQ
jgi:hypothetical protein